MQADRLWTRVPPLVRVPVDRCPRCRRPAYPAVYCDHGDDRTCRYRCPCGHRWLTHWSLRALGAPDPDEPRPRWPA